MRAPLSKDPEAVETPVIPLPEDTGAGVSIDDLGEIL
jgi:hypothetical protein